MIEVRDIQDVVCRHFGITREEMLEQNRKRIHSRPRQIAMFLSRELTRESLPDIGKKFCRDHTTILHATWARPKIENDPVWGTKLAAIRLDIADPRAAARRHYELHMRQAWKASIPFHLTPEYMSIHGGDQY